MASSVDKTVREGFLCPICLKDLGSVTQLQGHFEETHSEEDKDVLQQLRGLFGKTIKKFLGDKDTLPDNDKHVKQQDSLHSVYSSVTKDSYESSFWEPQELGQIRSWTDTFKSLRGDRVDRFVLETNKLIIRLDKLSSPDAPTDPSKRKAFEQSVVPWLPDKLIPMCPDCDKSFSLLRRRHHCRLCGDIMCDKCSEFLPYSFAKKILNPAFDQVNIKAQNGFLRRSDSNSSLNSMVGSEGEPHIRTCNKCRVFLERRHEQVQQRNFTPTIVLLYEKMKISIEESRHLMEEYMPMVESLSAGESTYRLSLAQALRAKILKKYELIDLLSKKIFQLGHDTEQVPSPKQMQLQKAIRAFATNYMQDNMIGLQSLPTEEQFSKLHEERKAKLKLIKERERQANLQAQEKENKLMEQKEAKNQSTALAPPKTRSDSKGADTSSQKITSWVPNELNVSSNDVDDPIIQQMNIIRGYMKQAKQAQKWDEVTMLEENLKDLQQEYLRQKQNS